MSYTNLIAGASSQAQGILAQTGGALPGKTNSLYKGNTFLGVYGVPQVERQMLASGGYRQRAMVPLTVTRTQFVVPPVSNTQWVRTDVAPEITYIINRVDLHDSYVYTLMLVRVGE